MSAAEQKQMQPDAVTIQEWCDWWFHQSMRGEIQIGWRDAASGKLNQFRSFAIGADEIGETVAAINSVVGQSCYVRAATVRPGLGGKAAEDSDFISAPGVWGDLDDEGAYQRASKVATLIRPSAWVETGTHPHWRGQCFWRLETPCDNPAAIERLNKRVVLLYSGDPSVTNPTRLMRLPGTVAWPSKPGRVPELTRLVMPPGRPASHTIDFLAANLPQEQERREQPQPEAAEGDGGWFDIETGPTVAAYLRRLREPAQWHNTALRLVAHWVGRGWSDAEILAMAEHLTLAGFTVTETRADLAQMLGSARSKWGVENHDHVVGGDGPATPFEGQPYDPWDALRPLAFPLDALPERLRAFASSRAVAIGCDPAAVAMAAFSALSAALHGSWRLRLKQHDPWSVPPALWVVLVGASSAKKSPAIKSAWHRLEEVQGKRLRQWSQALAEWEAVPKDMREAKPASPPRYVTHDATMESMQGILAMQDRGCGVLRDELAGFIGSMDKYASGRGGASDRAFWLQAFDGGHFVADRVGRGTVAIDNLLVSLCGGIQPDRLASFGDLADDGLWQRFIPVILAPPVMGQDVEAGEAEEKYDRLIDDLCGMAPRTMRLSVNARPVRQEAERRLFDLERSEMLGAKFSSFVGKLSGIWGRLALILQLCEGDELEGEVGRVAAEQASRLVFDYIMPSAARVYAAMGGSSSKGDSTTDAAGYVLTKRLPRLLASDLTRNVRTYRGLALGDVQAALSPLVAGGWLAPEKPHGGNNSWTVNPAVHDLFAERAGREAQRREAARETLQGNIKSGKDDDE